MSPDEERRDAQIEALISIVGSMLAVFDVRTDAADLWPETMRAGTAEEIRQVTADLADVLPAAILRRLREADAGSNR